MNIEAAREVAIFVSRKFRVFLGKIKLSNFCRRGAIRPSPFLACIFLMFLREKAEETVRFLFGGIDNDVGKYPHFE